MKRDVRFGALPSSIAPRCLAEIRARWPKLPLRIEYYEDAGIIVSDCKIRIAALNVRTISNFIDGFRAGCGVS